jgi:predicted AAA+ superfamily ATPase
MSDIAKQIKEYYDKGVFPESWLKNLLDNKKITQEEFDTITNADNI